MVLVEAKSNSFCCLLQLPVVRNPLRAAAAIHNPVIGQLFIVQLLLLAGWLFACDSICIFGKQLKNEKSISRG